MSKRPEHVRCENCCYWEGFAHGKLGFCLRYPQTVILAQVYSKEDVEKACHALPGSDARGVPIASGAEDFCGEFRAEWPVRAEDIEWPADALTYPQGIPWHGSPAGEDLKKGDAVELRDGKWWKVNDA